MATSLSLVFSLLCYWMTEIELGSLQTLYWKFFLAFLWEVQACSASTVHSSEIVDLSAACG
jgi:hypothetical protein